MTGCRYGAKNTLVKNYLGIAEKAGSTVHPLTTVTSLHQRPDGVWSVDTVRTGRMVRKKRRTFTAQYVVLAAGTWGTQNLLHKMKDTGTLPRLSDRLGVLTRTNSESILGAMSYKVDPALGLQQGLQCDGFPDDADDADDRWRRPLAALAQVPRPGRQEPVGAAARADGEELE
jgi:cholesterol oxidase